MHNDIDALFEDRDGVLWVATGLYGFHRYDPDTDSFERVHVIDRGQFEPEGFADIAQDSAGTFWLGAWGLVRFDPKTGETSRFLPHADLQQPTRDRLDNYVSTIEPAPVRRSRSYCRGE